MAKFVYDKENMRFNRKEVGAGEVFGTVVKYLSISFGLALLFYFFFALIFDTERERRIEMENKVLAQEYSRLEEEMALVDNVIENLEIKDREIYNDVFDADPPKYAVNSQDTSDSVRGESLVENEQDMIWDAYAAARRLEFKTARVNDWLVDIRESLMDTVAVPTRIPSILPVKNFTTRQTGASVGKKVNPFFKTVREHNGIDLVSPSGTEVVCTADGQVESVEKLGKGFGNRVTVSHGEEYTTTYSHLSEIFVRKGQQLKQGAIVGRVGSSGTTFAPCLHYEVLRNGEYQDPVNFFFADISADEYKEMTIIAMTTGQSLD